MEAALQIPLTDLSDNSGRASAFLRAMANESRLMILCRLAQSECSVTQLEELLEISQSALSQHLAVLRRMGLINQRREARLHYYSLESEEARDIMLTLAGKYCESQRP